MPYFNHPLLCTLLKNANTVSMTERMQVKINTEAVNDSVLYSTSLAEELQNCLFWTLEE